MTIEIVDRKTKKIREESVYGNEYLRLVYKETTFSKFLCTLTAKCPFFSYLYGLWQKSPFSKFQIAPFVKKFEVNLEESESQEFPSFNDFFIRKLKDKARPIASTSLIAPADGRYFVYENITANQEIFVKGKGLAIEKLFKGADQYVGGALIMARLAPPDYHRFHFPIDCVPSAPSLIGGYLYSVNPVALRVNANYITENKRVLVELKSETLGKVAFLAVGATNVGSIQFTYQPHHLYKRGEELGYFAFGASMVLVLIGPDKLHLAKDLLENTASKKETLCQMGESLI